jgi:hypothetical protein
MASTARLNIVGKDAKPILLAWSALVESSAGNDPLGLALRVGARITSQLLHCVTSITPRARYFSFLPWCIQDYKTREAGTKRARGLRGGIEMREHALVLGCVLHHEGQACLGGALTGSEKAQEWFTKGIPAQPDLSSRRFYKNPALDAYFGSLANFGLIRSTADATEIEDSDEEREVTFDDIELSDLGQRVADSYGLALRGVTAAVAISNTNKIPNVELRQWGKRGGLCELRNPQAPDREALRTLFFSPSEISRAHDLRRKTLLLMMHCADEFANRGFKLEASAFNDATYFGRLVDWHSEDSPVPVNLPDTLVDIAHRWRIYHFHHYCWFALESLFEAVVSEARAAGVEGTDLETLTIASESRAAASEAAEVLRLDSSVAIARLTPRELWGLCGFPDNPMSAVGSVRWDQVVGATHVLSERRIELVLRSRTFGFGTSVLLGITLMLSSLARYRRWEDTEYGHWLFGHTETDAFLDVTTPQILHFLRKEFEDFTCVPLARLATSVLRRFVIRQHEAMAFTKSHDGSRAFFHSDQGRIFVRADKAWAPRQDNGRLRSAVKILTDLAYLEEDTEHAGLFRRTPDGEAFLRSELATLAQT